MKSSIKRVSYAYNSLLEGSNPYFLDCLVVEDGETQLDVHKQFGTLEEFYQAVEEVIPVFCDETASHLELGDVETYEDR